MTAESRGPGLPPNEPAEAPGASASIFDDGASNMQSLIQVKNRVINVAKANCALFTPADGLKAANLSFFYGPYTMLQVEGAEAEEAWAGLQGMCGVRVGVKEETSVDQLGQPTPPPPTGRPQFVRMSFWDACSAGPSFLMPKPIFAGLSLPSPHGLAALVWVAGDERDGFDVGCQFWFPVDNVRLPENEHIPFREWTDRGYMRLTPGRSTDYVQIRADVKNLAAEGNLVKLMADPYNAADLVDTLKDQDGLPVEYLRQGFPSLSAPTTLLRDLILAGKIRHGDNPVLHWCVFNAVAVNDKDEGLKISLKQSRGPVAGVAALVNALAAAKT